MHQKYSRFFAIILAVVILGGIGYVWTKQGLGREKRVPRAVSGQEQIEAISEQKQKEMVSEEFQRDEDKSTGAKLEATGHRETIDTSDWKTYQNEKFGFEVKYPPHVKSENESTFYEVAKGFIDQEVGLTLVLKALSLEKSEENQSYCSGGEAPCIDFQYTRPIEWSEQKGILDSSIGGGKCSGESLWARSFCTTIKTGMGKFLEKITYSPPGGSFGVSRITYNDDLRYELSLVDFVPKIIGKDKLFCYENQNIHTCLNAIFKREVDKDTLNKIEIFDHFFSSLRLTKQQ
jgi:phage tail tube protein FII